MAMEEDNQPPPEPILECREPTLEDLVELCRWLNEEHAKYVVVGGFAIRLAGYNRRTMDVDLLIDTTPENEAAVYRAMSRLPDNAIRDASVGQVCDYGVLRVADEYMVDLMKSGCGVDYAMAIQDVVTINVKGVAIPVASPATLWRMKQTLREKDVPDKLFLRQWAEANQVTLDPPPRPTVPESNAPSWVMKLLSWIFPKKG